MSEENSEICTDGYSCIGRTVSGMYNAKANNNSVIKRYFRLKSPRNINNDDFEAVVAICGSKRTIFVLEPEPNYELIGGGIFSIKKYPAGCTIDISRYERIKKKSHKFGINMDSIGVTYETDGQTSNESGLAVKTLTHDVLIATLKGDKKLFGKQLLTPNIEYLEIDKRLEEQIYEYEVQKDIKNFNNMTIEDKNKLCEEYKNESLFERIFKFFK